MPEEAWIPLGTVLGSGLVAYLTARISRKKEPEDIQEQMQKMHSECLDQLTELSGYYTKAIGRMSRLEVEVIKLGGDPSKINGADNDI